MGFAEEHQRWLGYHKKCRTGERLDRLDRGHRHGEQMFVERVWWPIFGKLDDLHPEYEVADWRGRPYFVDFVWKPGQVKFAIEIKGYGPHVQNTDRTRYRQELNRETYLQIAGYRVIAIPYDDLESAPEQTISLLKAVLTPSLLKTSSEGSSQFTRIERDILRMASRMNGMIRPVDVVEGLGVNRRTARKYINILCEKGKFKPVLAQDSSRVCRYELIHSFIDSEIW
ncbi:RAP domain-containing protein [Paenibacillus silagei]|uniref:Transcriptional regulator n=1 Tax=Paenibacillus silagei TaxID=1670801 RepID=A0ABS4NVE7_9BACL|nr:RAP domain-containing protein [Paenibacillus silagei]MBP2113262.1 putative transcriptional regulator [Paenibacillus silagei]